ncbi:MAG: hypothetical protein JKX85_13640, partial [Phycisphaeraceae bacterium]|nr:hypothetical protein [Phycisphaeraceae bacterium]
MDQAFAELDLKTGRFTDPVQLLSAVGFSSLNISDFDVNAAGKIIGIDKSAGAGNTRLVQIDTDAHYNEPRNLAFTTDTGSDILDVQVPSILVHALTEDGAVDDNLVGYASSYDLEGNVYFYSVYDHEQMNNLLLRSYNDNAAGNAVNDIDHIPMPSLQGELSNDYNIEALAVLGVQDSFGNERVFFFHDPVTSNLRDVNPFFPINDSTMSLVEVSRDVNGNVTGSTTIGNVVDRLGGAIHSIFDATADPTDPLVPTLTPARPLDLSSLLVDPSTINNIDNTTSPTTFDIQLDITGGLSDSQISIFVEAVNFWESIIIADIPDYTDEFGTIIDDLIITASGQEIDGVNGILGQAGPTIIRGAEDNFLPAAGIMQFDTADLASLEANGQLRDVIIHEMGHVLGFGTLWDLQGLLNDTDLQNPFFTGVQATAEYESLFGITDSSGVPVEQDGGQGTAYAHWDETTFDNELMTGFINAGINPLSRITVASLADQGYGVNISNADAYSPPGTGALTGLQLYEDQDGWIFLGGDALNYTGNLSGSFLAAQNYSHIAAQNDGTVFVITGTGLGATLSQIPVTNTSAINTIGTISDNSALTQLLQVTAVGADPNNDNVIYGVGSTADALLPTDVLGSLGTLNLNVQALTVVSDNTVYIVSLNDNNTAGSTTDDFYELYKVTRDATTGLVSSTTNVGKIVDSNGVVITEINAIAANAADELYIIGYNADVPNPNVNVGGDLGNDYNIVGITADNQNQIYALNLDQGPYIGLYNINRDTDGSLSDTDAYEFVANVTESTNGFPLLNIRAITDNGTDLFALGYAPDQLVPLNSIGDTSVINSEINSLQGLTITTGDELLAVDLRSNGLTYLYNVERNAVNVVTGITLVDVVNNAGQAILGLSDLEAGDTVGTASQVFGVGSAEGALLPADLLDNLSTILDVRAMAVTNTGDIYAVYKDATDQNFHLAYIALQTDGSFTFTDVGAIVDTGNTNIFDIAALEESGGNLFLVGVSASALLPATAATDTNDALTLGTSYNVKAISATNSDKQIFAINNEQSSALYEISRDASGNVTAFNRIGQIVDSNGNAFVDIQATDYDPQSGLLSAIGISGSDLVPTAIQTVNLAGEDIRAITVINNVFYAVVSIPTGYN